MSKTTQEQYVQLAWNATARAEKLARDAERYARDEDFRHKVEPLATAGRLWAEVAQSYTAIIAAVLPEPLPELPTAGTEY
ncbi:hypothetical protein OH768_44115 [Streptomyces sp. NBC_01622]|uniref:hypothetical protein n=1 Tax=Streptomyces sp. NBC_01622 TaxID=2975903 RepID=UPI00386912A1|nr:hypothetical protein OH768_44115 [Streptomyces sp. NBC_01622]